MTIRSLNNQKCFITGAASGIGKAVAIQCAREGARLFLTDINEQMLAAVAQQIVNEGGRVDFYRALDVADYEAVTKMAQDIEAEFGSMNIIMNIAGISTWGHITKLENKHWRDCLEVNLMGPIHVMENFIPGMIKAKQGGHVVNVSSAAGLFGLPLHAPYSASKFGLRGVSEVLRFDLHKDNIGFSLVCPGGVDTGLVKTINIVGVDKNNPELEKYTKLFQRHAVSPEKAARAIIKGIKKNKYMVYTSLDIAVGHWFQRVFPFSYNIFMRIANGFFQKVINKLQG